MSFKKQVIVDLVEIVENGCVQVRTRTSIVENDEIIGSSLHRHVIVPGADYSSEDPRVKAICKATHTSTVIADYKALMAASLPF